MPGFNPKIREYYYEPVHQTKVRLAMEDTFMFLVMSLEVVWQRCARQNMIVTPQLKSIQMDSEMVLEARMQSASLDFNNAPSSAPDQEPAPSEENLISLLQPLMNLTFCYKKYGDKENFEKHRNVHEYLLKKIQTRLPNDLRIEHSTLWGSIINNEAAKFSQLIYFDANKNAQPELQELIIYIRAIEDHSEDLLSPFSNPFLVNTATRMGPSIRLRRLLGDSPMKPPWQLLSYSYLNCRFAILLMLSVTLLEFKDNPYQVGQFFQDLDQKYIDLGLSDETGSIFTFFFILVYDPKFRRPQRTYLVARLVRTTIRHLPDAAIHMLSEQLYKWLVADEQTLDTLAQRPSGSIYLLSQRLHRLHLRTESSGVSDESATSDIGGDGKSRLTPDCSSSRVSKGSFEDKDTSLPIDSLGQPSIQTEKYLNFFTTSMWHEHPHPQTGFSNSWGLLALKNPPLLYSITGAAATRMSLNDHSLNSRESQDCIVLKTRAISLIRENMSRPTSSSATSDATIASISFLALSDATDTGNLPAAQAHHNGLQQLVTLRPGGLAAITWPTLSLIYTLDVSLPVPTLPVHSLPFPL